MQSISQKKKKRLLNGSRACHIKKAPRTQYLKDEVQTKARQLTNIYIAALTTDFDGSNLALLAMQIEAAKIEARADGHSMNVQFLLAINTKGLFRRSRYS